MKLLVTGFSSFPGVPVNPCEEVVAWIAENYSSTDVCTTILPVSYARSVERLTQCISQCTPDVVIEFGVSNRAKGIKLESVGYNARHAGIPDVDGILCTREIIDANVAYETVQRTKWKIESMCKSLRAHCQLDVEISSDPGRYVCNNLYWKSMRQFPDLPIIFVHIPPINQQKRPSLMQSVGQLLDWTLLNPHG